MPDIHWAIEVACKDWSSAQRQFKLQCKEFGIRRIRLTKQITAFDTAKPSTLLGKLRHAFKKAVATGPLRKKIARCDAEIRHVTADLFDTTRLIYRKLGEICLDHLQLDAGNYNILCDARDMVDVTLHLLTSVIAECKTSHVRKICLAQDTIELIKDTFTDLEAYLHEMNHDIDFKSWENNSDPDGIAKNLHNVRKQLKSLNRKMCSKQNKILAMAVRRACHNEPTIKELICAMSNYLPRSTARNLQIAAVKQTYRTPSLLRACKLK